MHLIAAISLCLLLPVSGASAISGQQQHVNLTSIGPEEKPKANRIVQRMLGSSDLPESGKTPGADHQFDQGSHLYIAHLTSTQINNLVLLAKVWGFLKYHHSQITSGARHWDYDLLRLLPVVLKAKDTEATAAILVDFIDKLGPIPECRSCTRLDKDLLQLHPDVAWISSGASIGEALATRLRLVYNNRSDKQFYVSQGNTGSPSFEQERAYERLTLPDKGFQLLSLFRYWNIIEYWYPYRNTIDESWDQVLKEFIPTMALANDPLEYKLALMRLIAKVHDSHANLWSAVTLRPPGGSCDVPFDLRPVEGAFMVTATLAVDTGEGVPKVGDILTAIDGVSVPTLLHSWRPYYGFSNEGGFRRDVARFMTRGACGIISLTLLRGSLPVIVNTERVANLSHQLPKHDLPGPAFRLLSPEVAYLKLSAVKHSAIREYVSQAINTKGWIIDIRNYPSESIGAELGGFMVDKKTPFARITVDDLSNPGAFTWIPPLQLSSQEPHYPGKIVILVDEATQSQAEFAAMALRSGGHSIVVGSATAGADGNVSAVVLPGGEKTTISGVGVFYPDKRPTQRVGLVPDIIVTPTIDGVRSGTDEVLAEGLRQIVGNEAAITLSRSLQQ